MQDRSDDIKVPPDQTSMKLEGDVLVVQAVGTIGAGVAQTMIDMGEQLYTSNGYILLLIDAKHSKGMDVDARKLQTERFKRFIRPSHTAVYHVNAVGRVMSTLMRRGLELISGTTYPISFHADEAEARACLAEQRLLLRPAAAQPTP